MEVQLDTSGQLVDVKVAHQGENPTVSTVQFFGGFFLIKMNETSLLNTYTDSFPLSSELS